MHEETFIRLVNSQTQALTQVSMISTSTKEVLEKVVDNQAAQTTLLQSINTGHMEFRDRTFNVLVGVIIFEMLVIAGLMLKLNIKGAEVIQDSVVRAVTAKP